MCIHCASVFISSSCLTKIKLMTTNLPNPRLFTTCIHGTIYSEYLQFSLLLALLGWLSERLPYIRNAPLLESKSRCKKEWKNIWILQYLKRKYKEMTALLKLLCNTKSNKINLEKNKINSLLINNLVQYKASFPPDYNHPASYRDMLCS